MARKTLCAGLAGALVLLMSACSLDFLSTATATAAGADQYHYVLSADGLTKQCYDAGNNLVWTENYTYDGARHLLTLRRFNARGVLQYSQAWSYTAAGQADIEARYNALDSLVYYSHFTYDAGGRLILTVQYDSAQAVQYIEARSWDSQGLLAGCRRFGPGTAGAYPLQWASTYSYDTSGKCLVEKNYGPSGAQNGSVVHSWNADGTESRREYWGTASTASAAEAVVPAAASGARALVLPIAPADPVPPNPVLTDGGLSLSRYTLWFYDSYGSSVLDFTAAKLLTKMQRTDSRLPRASGVTASSTIATTVSWDTSQSPPRLSGKTTTFNGTTALAITLGYAADGWVNKIDASGAAMYLPLSLAVSYKSPSQCGGYLNVPDRVEASSNGVALYSFRFDLSAGKLPAAANSLLALKPADITGGKFLVIRNYDGGNKYLGAYTLDADASPNLKIWSAKADGSSNGWFIMEKDSSGANLGFSAYRADGSQAWNYIYDYQAQALGLYRQASSFSFDINRIIQVLAGLDPAAILNALS